jgi:hypothetical protein
MRKVIGTTIIIAFVTYFFFGTAPFIQLAEFAKGFAGGLALTSQGAIQINSPNFKVRHHVKQVEGACKYNPSGTLCLQHSYYPYASLTIQSANDYTVELKEVVINEKSECTVKESKTMTLGDTYEVPLGGCDPIKVRIVTDRGEAVYNFD